MTVGSLVWRVKAFQAFSVYGKVEGANLDLVAITVGCYGRFMFVSWPQVVLWKCGTLAAQQAEFKGTACGSVEDRFCVTSPGET